MSRSGGRRSPTHSAAAAARSLQRTETLLAGEKRVLEMIAQGASLATALEHLTRTIEAQSEAGLLASILLLDEDGLHLRHGAAPSLPVAYNRAIDGAAIGPQVGSCGTAAYRGEPVVVTDIASDPLWTDFRDLALCHGLRACWSTPILSSEGKVLGTFALYYPEARSPTQEDQQLIDLVIRTASIVLERARVEEQLRRSQRRLADFVENATEGLHWLDQQGRIVWVNQAQLDLLGYSRAACVGRHIRELHVDPAVADEMLRRLATGDRLQGYEARLLASDGSIKDVLINASVYREDGQLIQTHCFTRDITEQKRAERERECLHQAERQARAAAEAALRARDEFLSIASHELRNPIAGIKAAAQLLQRSRERGQLDQERLDRYLAIIDQTSARLAVLIDDLLNVSRLQAGKLVLRHQPTDLARLVRTAVARHQEQTETHRFVLEVDEVGLLDLDPDRVEQIMTNLLENAVKYSPEAGEIEVSLERSADGAVLQVRDSGIGLPAGAAERIFEPFGRAANAAERNIPGLGLGLYICRQIAEAHGGRLWAESAGPDQGTTVSLWLPGERPADQADLGTG